MCEYVGVHIVYTYMHVCISLFVFIIVSGDVSDAMRRCTALYCIVATVSQPSRFDHCVFSFF